MRTSVEQRRRISRYFIIVLFMGLAAGSLNTESHWPVFAAITGPTESPALDGRVASAAFQLHDVQPRAAVDVPRRLRQIAEDSLSAQGLRPADRDQLEVEPLEFAVAAAIPPATPAPAASDKPVRSRPDGSAGGGGCGGRADGFVPPGCLVREVARTMKHLDKDARRKTAHSLRKVAGDAVAKNHDHEHRPGHGDTPSKGHSSKPDRPDKVHRSKRPDRPEKVHRSKRPDRPEKVHRPKRPDRPEKVHRPRRPDRPERVSRPSRPDRPHRGGRDC